MIELDLSIEDHRYISIRQFAYIVKLVCLERKNKL